MRKSTLLNLFETNSEFAPEKKSWPQKEIAFLTIENLKEENTCHLFEIPWR